MKKIFCKTKTGFDWDFNRDFIIYDVTGKVFYTNKFLRKKRCRFNLPEGTFWCDRIGVKKLLYPVKHKRISLPPYVRNLNISDFKVIYADNPRKCTIDWNSKTITFDHSYKTRREPERLYTMAHEIGHRHYGTNIRSIELKEMHEENADAYAYNLLIEYGLNPSQIFYAQYCTLTNPLAYQRKSSLITKIVRANS